VRRAAPGAAGLAAALALAAGSAGAAPERTALIRPAQGIGKLRLGMSQPEVRRALGRPRAVVRRPAGFGLRSIEWEYGYASYRVRFFGPAGRLRTTRIGTTLRRERTPRNVGVGSRERAVRRVYPGLRCERLELFRAGPVTHVVTSERDCTLVAPSGRRTIFTSTAGPEGPLVPPGEWERRAQVVEVSVAEAG
jgi:hypothetical protein